MKSSETCPICEWPVGEGKKCPCCGWELESPELILGDPSLLKEFQKAHVP
jgi:hypothetical protein